MYKIKQLAEDFIVREIGSTNPIENGEHAYFILKKKNYTTIDALQALSNKFGLPLSNFGFAGNKDRNAITEQKISIFRGSKDFADVALKDIELKYAGNAKTPISLGELEGNEFIITIRNLEDGEVEKITKLENTKIKVPNLYGPQRFSKNNHLVGYAILKRDFKKAITLILENKGKTADKITNYLNENKNNFIGALRLIPLKTLRIYLHSYQSFLFNETVKKFLQINRKAKNTRIPLVGFGFEIGDVKNTKLRNVIKKIIQDEKISPREFIISQVPELTSEGGSRDLFFELKFKIIEISNDELNQEKKKAKINFLLPKSCYATVAIDHIF